MFGLDAIVRDELVYGVTGGTRRRRGRNGKGKGREKRWGGWPGLGMPLELELSFGALGEDERLAGLMMGSARDEVEAERWTGHRDAGGELERREAGSGNSVVGSFDDVEAGGLGLRAESREVDTRWQAQEPPVSHDLPAMMTDSDWGHGPLEGGDWELLDESSESCGGSEVWFFLDE